MLSSVSLAAEDPIRNFSARNIVGRKNELKKSCFKLMHLVGEIDVFSIKDILTSQGRKSASHDELYLSASLSGCWGLTSCSIYQPSKQFSRAEV